MKKTLAAAVALALAAAAPASALEWDTMGPRAMGMGGAGVALPQGPIASYWNPAALGRATQDSYGLQIPVDVHAALTGTVVEGAKDLSTVNSACQAGNLTVCTSANINNALIELNNPGNGLRANGSAGGDFKVGKLAVFARGYLDAGAVPRIDLVNNTPATVANNTSALIVKGARILEFGAGYGHELPFAPGVYLGADVKLMKAEVGYTDYLVVNNNNNSSSIISSLKNSAANSGNFGIDAGALWDVNRTFDGAVLHPRLGVTGRNLNNPKFAEPATAAADGVNGKFAVNPQVRMGASISPFHWWNIAADMDLTRNLTPVDGVASRQLSLGTEINVFNRSWINIPLRVGFARNTAESSNMVTAGAGLNFLHLMLDVSGEASPKRVQTQSQGNDTKIPQELGASVQLSLLFGGSEDAPKNGLDNQPAPAKQALPPSPPAKVDQVKKDAAKAQQDLDKESAQPH